MGRRHIFVRELELDASIGVLEAERARPQRLVVSVTLEVDDAPVASDRIDQVVDYRRPVEHARALAAAGHIDLVETLADRLAAACLAEPGVRNVLIRIEKPGAIPGAAAAGVELFRESPAMLK